jgi:hypothetical protein
MQLSSTVMMLTIIRHLHVHIATIVSKCHLLPFQFLSEHMGNSSCGQLLVSETSNYRLHLLTGNGNFICYCLLRNAIILADHVISVISVSLIGHRLLIMVFHYAACHSGWHV